MYCTMNVHKVTKKGKNGIKKKQGKNTERYMS